MIDADGGPISQSLSSADGTQLVDAVSDDDPSSDDELFGLLENTSSASAGRKVTNGSYSVSGGVTHGVQQYTGNMSSMLTGINMSQSTVVQ